ncbi:MAG: succinylglutamate desuccinylase [Bacilli bacterium]|nr:succinylglutamate desuccinylase [Bacilli bacterium]
MKKYLENKRINLIITLVLILASVVIAFIAGKEFVDFRNDDQEFIIGPNVTRIEKFSDYNPNLKETVGDADIFILEGSVSPIGPSLLILGGTHPNEPSGQLTSVLFLENLEVEYGTVYIVTEANRSAYSATNPQEGSPMYYDIETESGIRTFKFGSRATSFVDQWPNPDIFVHPASGQQLSNQDTRNLNRSYPGRIDGYYTERVAYAITQLIIQNNITITIDLHEASPEYMTNNAIVAHPGDAMNIAAHAYLYLELAGIIIKTETSPVNLRGLTHRELGLYTDTLAFLCETSNASQGRIHGEFTEELIVEGKDKFYEKAEELGLLEANPTTIHERVARHMATIMQIVTSYNAIYNPGSIPGQSLILNNMPSYNDVMDQGIGKYLK